MELLDIQVTISALQVKEGDEGNLLLGEQDEGATSSMTNSYYDEDRMPLDNEVACTVGHVCSVGCGYLASGKLNCSVLHFLICDKPACEFNGLVLCMGS